MAASESSPPPTAATATRQAVPRILFKDKQARIILILSGSQQPWYLSTLSKACDTTYVHTSNFIKTCEEMGITTNERHGKIKEIKLTDKGVQLATLLSSMYSIMNQTNNSGQQLQKKAEPSKDEKREEKGEKAEKAEKAEEKKEEKREEKK